MSPVGLRRRIGRLVILGFEGESIPAELRSLARDFGLGGVILLGRNRNIVEPEIWVDVDRRRRAARAAHARGEDLDAEERAHAQFTLAALFSDPRLRRLTIIGSLMSLTTTVAWWGVSTWVPPYVASLGPPSMLSPEQWAGVAGMAYNVGAVAGYISLGFAADRFGRKPVTAAYFLLFALLIFGTR